MMEFKPLIDAAYRRRREAGATGWATDQGIDELYDRTWQLLDGRKAGIETVLDLGCGAGELAERFHLQRVTAVDLSSEAIAWARERSGPASRVEYVEGDVTDPDLLPGARYDLVVDGRCLHCLVGSAREAFFRNVRRWTGKYFVVHAMCGDPQGEVAEGFDWSERVFRMPDGRPQRFVGTEAGLKEELSAAGFELVESMMSGRTMPEELDDLHALCRVRGERNHA